MTPEDRAQRIQEIRERLAKATAGPWTTGVGTPKLFTGKIVGVAQPNLQRDEATGAFPIVAIIGALDADPELLGQTRADAAFIAHCPADLAFLLSEYEGMQTQAKAVTVSPEAWELATRKALAQYDWSKKELAAIEDFILTVRFSAAEILSARG